MGVIVGPPCVFASGWPGPGPWLCVWLCPPSGPGAGAAVVPEGAVGAGVVGAGVVGTPGPWFSPPFPAGPGTVSSGT